MKKISFSQAILILIDKESKTLSNQEMEALKRLYFLGSKNEETIQEILNHPLLEDYTIDRNYETINNDPTRRFFETLLALKTLKSGITELDENKIDQHYAFLLSKLDNENENKLNSVLRASETGVFDGLGEILFFEYADAIKNASSQEFKDLLGDDKSAEKVKKMFMITIASQLVGRCKSKIELPLPMGATGYYTKEFMGRIEKADNLSAFSNKRGIMKSSMPIYSHCALFSQSKSPYMRPADARTFDQNAKWVQNTFSYGVHPFCNSISSTFFVQLKIFKFLLDSKELQFNTADLMKNYFKCFISGLMYNSGGHSLYEFTYPLRLPEIQAAYKNVTDFDAINLESLFFNNNSEAFDAALKETITYTNSLLLRNDLLQSLKFPD